MNRTVFSGDHLSVEHRSREVRGLTQIFEVVTRPHIVVCVPRVSKDQFLLVRQYRAGEGGHTLEFPAGRVEAGEGVDDAMRRELLEEAGYVPHRLSRLGHLRTAPHFSDELATVFMSYGEIGGSPKPTPREEFLPPEILSSAKVSELISGGALTDAKTIAAFFMAQTRLSEAE